MIKFPFQFPWNRSHLPILLGSALAVLLPALAVVQYRWISQLSMAEQERLESKLKESVTLFTREFNSELNRINAFLLAPRSETSNSGFALRYRRWATNNSQIPLIKTIYRSSGGPRGTEILEAYYPEKGIWEPVQWPISFQKMKEQAEWRPPPEGQLQARPPGPRPSRDWFDKDVIAATAPRLDLETDPELGSPIWSQAVLQGWTIVEFDRTYLQTQYFPELAERHFGDDYRIRIATRGSQSNLIYQSEPDASVNDFNPSDATGSLFDIRPESPSRLGPPPMGGGPPGGRNPAAGPPPEPRGRWAVSVRHKAGSIAQAAGMVRNRNLLISFAILLLMAGTMGLLITTTRRSQHLAHQQMEFVASVSHELRTPLAVIRSAGDNLADGLVTSEGQVRRYGSLIRNEGRRLSDMVEQIMSFAGLEKGKAKFEFTSVDVNAIIQRAVASCEPTLKDRGCRLEMDIPEGLPHVLADPNSLAHCLQNLLTNAAKYANESGWIGLTARTLQTSSGQQLEISVEDHGPGIAPADLPHIFEPFYRGKKAVEDQIHGTGLGLSLVKRIMEAHSGRIEVQSVSGKGSIFTLRLPATQAG